MKYRVEKTAKWKDFVTEPAGPGQPVKEVDTSDLKTSDNKPLPSDVVQLFVRRKILVPVSADTPAE